MNTFRFHSTTKYFISSSLVFIIAGIGLLIFLQQGFRVGIEFSPGINMQFHLSRSTDVDELQSLFGQEINSNFQVRQLGDVADNNFIIRVPDTGAADFRDRIQETVITVLTAELGTPQIDEVIYIETGLSRVLRSQTFILVAVTLLLILIYLWFRFHIHYAIAAIIATLHDVIFITLFIGATGIELSASTVAAVLTIIGYSLNDTIVVFDRIRENMVLMRHSSINEIIDTSITQSLSRTLVTSLTTLIAIIAIIIFALGPVRDFAITLSFGVIVGTYSSIFIASPVLYLFRRRLQRYKSQQDEKGAGSDKPVPALAADTSPTRDKTRKEESKPRIDVNTLKREMGWKKKSSRKKGS